MCYILYGAMENSINQDDYERAMKNADYAFKLGTKHDVKMCIVNNSFEYRVTKWVCDCDFPVGQKDENAKELKELEVLLTELKAARNAKCLYLSKTWAARKNKNEKTVHIDDIDIVGFLANMELDCLYRIDLLDRY